MHQQLSEWLPLVKSIAWQAAAVILAYYQQQSDLDIQDKGGEEGPVTKADIASNEVILQGLQKQFGTAQFAYLSEETDDDLSRLDRDWVWIIDPLDGTHEFVERKGEFAIHIGLAYQQRPVLGIVALPALGKLYSAAAGQGAYVEDREGNVSKLQVSDRTDPATMVVIASRSHRGPKLNHILSHVPKAQEYAVGSIGGKFAALAEGKADYYISVSGQSAPKDWDYCAPELILQEAGGRLTRFDGSVLTYNNPDIVQWGDIIASNGHNHDYLCQLCQRAAQQFAQL
ncbi:MAG: 3'(2'),5'-bisphosphate nucleotidase CysQ [Pseudanabaenaceae cyanobacterium SKYGB_i_bin29]|nr:3'(2'),5'-bisphosphate nucleotidase CysQ [Pseudanabaenaceae cyanobacterium SKYG29]MDW8422054.1 3'(2'),5'-bisphosphate nucleotidase CysQ [Pseudanabaenaceae cyanobacterium SKYGB_i_bin29]